MSDMQWKKANGDTGHYTGPLVPLGQGIPRELPDHGIRRATFDLAFGYVSGFPVRDILAFSARSLFPSKPLTAIVEELDEDTASHVGTVHLLCPECGHLMPATVSAEVATEEDGTVRLACTPDMSDVWAHVWTHDPSPTA